jgi:hypothetical protein
MPATEADDEEPCDVSVGRSGARGERQKARTSDVPT